MRLAIQLVKPLSCKVETISLLIVLMIYGMLIAASCSYEAFSLLLQQPSLNSEGKVLPLCYSELVLGVKWLPMMDPII